MDEDHEEAGYEFEKGRQRLLAEQEAEYRIYANQKRSRVKRKCCKGFWRVVLAVFLFYFSAFLGIFFVGGPIEKIFDQPDWTDPVWLLKAAGLLLWFLMFIVVPPVLAFIGAMNMLSGCLMGLSDD